MDTPGFLGLDMAQSSQLSLSQGMMIPRDYQTYGAKFLASRSGAILADDLGTGKTLQAAEAWKILQMKGPTLLIARPNTQSVWLKQAPRCGIQTPYIISGPKNVRAKEWSNVDQYSFVGSTVEAVRQDIKDTALGKIKWYLIIVEEAHRFSNRKTVSWKVLKELRKVCQHIIFITGSPMRRGFGDLWGLLNLCDHKRWSSYWGFLQTYGHMQLNEWGAWEVLGLRDREGLSKAIAPYFLRRMMEEVAPEVPRKTRILDHILELTPLQEKMYNTLNDEMILELSDDSLIVAQNVLVKITRLRQLLCTPKILDPQCVDWGASLLHLKEVLEESDQSHFVVFTPFVPAIQITADFLQQEVLLPPSKIHRLQGGIEAQELNRRVELFQQEGGCMICSIAYAESFDLIPAKWAYFLGASWDPFQNLQAEDRLRRLITTWPTFYFYPTHLGCIDNELVLEACNEKSTEVLKVYKGSASVLRHLLSRRRSV